MKFSYLLLVISLPHKFMNKAGHCVEESWKRTLLNLVFLKVLVKLEQEIKHKENIHKAMKCKRTVMYFLRTLENRMWEKENQEFKLLLEMFMLIKPTDLFSYPHWEVILEEEIVFKVLMFVLLLKAKPKTKRFNNW